MIVSVADRRECSGSLLPLLLFTWSALCCSVPLCSVALCSVALCSVALCSEAGRRGCTGSLLSLLLFAWSVGHPFSFFPQSTGQARIRVVVGLEGAAFFPGNVRSGLVLDDGFKS